MRLLPQERSRLGRHGPIRRTATAQLGRSAVLGGAVFDRQHHFRLHLGPLDAETFESLLPGGSGLAAARALVAQYVGLEFGWDLRLELHHEARKPCALGRQGRLGWTTWLGPPRGGQRPALLLDPGSKQALI
jgi:type VI secretion system protein ImpH